jgi:hypothetical protein
MSKDKHQSPPIKRPDLILKRVSIDLTDTKEHIVGTIIEALEYEGGLVRLQIKQDTGEVRWINQKPRNPPPPLPNAPKVQPCDNCGRPAKRIKKDQQTATYHCSGCGCNTIISLRRTK